MGKEWNIFLFIISLKENVLHTLLTELIYVLIQPFHH